MDILFLSHRLPFPPNKGEKLRTFYQIKQLTESGHRVTVYSPLDNQMDVYLSEEFEELNQVKSKLFKLPIKPARLLKGLVVGESLSEANFFSTELQQQFEQDLVAGRFEAIVCTSSAMAKYLFDSKAYSSLANPPKLLMDFMDLDSDKWRQYSEQSSGPMAWLYKRECQKVGELEQRSQQLFDACYFIAQAEVDLFQKQIGANGNVKILGNGLNQQEFYPPENKIAPATDAPVFIFTGVMDYKPNVDAVLWFVEHCWAEVKAKYAKAKFIVAGMNPSSEIQTLSSDESIVVTGFVDDILPYFHQADYFVAPFRLARGVQNKVLQAFACGLPVITTPMGAEGIPCFDNEQLLLAETPEQFVEAIDRLQNTAELRNKLATNALELIQQEFSWQGKLKPLVEQLAC